MLEKKGVSATVADARFAKPLDVGLLKQLAKNHRRIITIEEGSIGGFGSYVLDQLNRLNLLNGRLSVRNLHLPDLFQEHDTPEKQYQEAGLTAAQIARHADDA
jgi:1-deoxy-D-xylulose-5-phosphate synthase